MDYMNLNKKTRGAVSVFLVMILVPCIVVSSVFVDIGRVHLSKANANSAADLALNSLLTNFDADLKDWYGVVASCQNIDDFYEASAKLFLRTISSQDLSDDEIYLLSDYYSHVVNDDKIYDLLQVDCETATIEKVDGANLANPTMLKKQIVEFMKYRGPIEMTANIIERIKNDTSFSSVVEADENEDLVDDKTEFYEAEGELLAAAFNTYVALYDYYNDTRAAAFDNAKLQSYADSVSGYKTSYEEINRVMIKNLYNTGGLTAYSRVCYNLNAYNTTYTEKSSDVYSKKEKVDNVDHYYIDLDKITSLLDDLDQKITDFNTARSNYSNAASSLMGKLPGNNDSQSYPIQWWVQTNNAVNASNGHTAKVKTAADNMLRAYSKVLAIKLCEFQETESDETADSSETDWETRFNDLTSKVVSLQANYLTAGKTNNNDAYLKAVNQLETVSKNNINSISPSNVNVTVDGQSKSISEAIPNIQSNLKTIKNELNGYIDELNIIIDGNESDKNVAKNDKVKSLDGLLALARKYHTTYNTFVDTAKNTDTNMGKEVCEDEIPTLQNEMCEEITEEAVRTLKTRLVNIRSQLKSVVNAIDSMTYGEKKLVDIGGYDALKSAASSSVSSADIKLINSELNSYVASKFTQLFKPTDSSVIKLSHMDDANYNMTINPADGKIQTPNLFVVLHKKFKGASKTEIDKSQKELDDGEKTGNNKGTEAKDKGRYHGGGSDIKKDFSASGNFSLVDDGIASIVDLFQCLINMDVTSIRDELYVTEYIMEMFSYSTFEDEGLYGLVEKKDELCLPDSGYRPTPYSNLIGDDNGADGTWKSINPVDRYNKTLTNKLINLSNNSAYCAEVEYILYGNKDDKGNDGNIKAVYSDIYGLRYALNLVSAFANFWSGNSSTALAIDAVAVTVQGLSAGVIPVPVTKVVLLPILTAFETSKDLDRLEAGFPVELYKKNIDNWWIKIPELDDMGTFMSSLTSNSNKLNGPNQDSGIFYSDYLTVFVYLGLQGSSSKAMYQRMAEVMQANMRNLPGNNAFSIQNSLSYFSLNAKMRVKPLMITLPFFKEDEYKNSMDAKSDWCTYKINTVRGY